MTKQDFISLANHIRSYPGLYTRQQVENLADWLASQNPRFLRSSWLGYVYGENGPNGGKRKN